MLLVVVAGFPRTGTTLIYRLCYEILKNELGVRDLVGVFEPFNGEVVEATVLYSSVVHDVEGSIPHDFHMLPKELQYLIISNVKWFWTWMLNCNCEEKYPWLGKKWSEILSWLHRLPNPVLLKDVHIWPTLSQLVENYRETLFILTLRDLESLNKAYQAWLRSYSLLRSLIRIAKRLFKKSRKPLSARICDAYLYSVRRWKVESLFGLAAFHELLYGERPRVTLLDMVFGTVSTKLSNVLTRVYSRYEDIVERVRHRENVLVIEYKDTMSIPAVREMLREALRKTLAQVCRR